MEALGIHSKKKGNHLSLIPANADERLFRKIEINPGVVIYDFNEMDLQNKIESLISQFDLAFNTELIH
ncbi:hypothetical protein [Portibacter marinus]|uniref:hypothetical protein n=1 Tax=Portibacter marinus TaxID=2898660 RepID=UPI001F213E38|nr:hypothetical protein [Portibacter marinus]